jgi:Fe-S oxidoreductase
MACVQACPVGINHVDQIVGNRRHMALMEGSIPAEAQPTLRAIEMRGNPYGAPEDRANWLQGLPVKVLSPGDSVDYLYWVGCVSAYDQRKQKIAKSLVSIMNKAGLSFGVLGSLEGCTGDPARRLGEENLFQTMAKQNIELLKSVSFKYLVANCPHCFNTIKNEYPQFGNLSDGAAPEIIHHSVLLKKLLAEEKVSLKGGDLKDITFHDPCYLGRYNEEYDAPRSTLKSVKGLRILEMERSRENGLCCGAGGGHFWMDLKVGERVNTIRVKEAAETGASTVATACPFCMQMMEDGVKLTDNEHKLDVRDIAEVIAERLA